MRFMFLCCLSVCLSACASKGIPYNQIYQVYGLKPAEGPASRDGIYQDFSLHNDNVGVIWLDPDAQLRGADELASVQPWMIRNEGRVPFLRVAFSRQGHGTNIAIPPKNKIPERLSKDSQLSFSMRSDDAACVGVRIREQDGEVWLYGKPELDYERLCTKADGNWHSYQLPLSSGSWSRFPYNGNTAFGNNVREHDALTTLSLEIGVSGRYYFSEGPGVLDIKDIRIQ